MDSVAGVRRWGAPRISFHIVLIGLMASCVAACEQRASDKAAEKARLQQAGQPVDPYAAAGHIIGARVAVLTSDTRAAEQNDLARSARIRDVQLLVDCEAARARRASAAGCARGDLARYHSLVAMIGAMKHRFNFKKMEGK